MVYINEHGDKQLCTPPLNGLILPGVTRRSILELASQWEEFTVKEEIITMDQVITLNKQGRQSQPVFQRIKDTLLAIQYGHIEHPFTVVIS
ncbi:hypothetical protein MSG28_001529 [Choristoneura fumiferana]|uniref:Uncharacterized protein n=1 Tax=Choristoneura fumiferana TaxID=7141 RepID=A0ACC0KUG6_CHOFU|nr:hypothetical protein MSG28_001529 [Choristoneura fumiferana]